MYGNPSLSKLCKKNTIRNVVGQYKISFMVYFEFWFGRKFSVKKGQIWPFMRSVRHPYA